MVQILDRLAANGHDTFIDRVGNRFGDPVSANVEEALRTSTLCLVYYSERYELRHACQFELMQALSADVREGGQMRTVVINPESSKAHVQPAVLKDQIYLTDDGGDADLARIIDEVERHLARLTGTYKGIDFSALPRMVGGRPGVAPKVRRYSAMWRLERALHAQRYRLTHQPTNGIAVLTGLRGVGKTTLADDYIMHFAHAYQVVIRVDLADATGPTAQSTLRDVVTEANNTLLTSKGHALVVIDSVPAGLPIGDFGAALDNVDVLLLIISEHTEYAALGQEVRLGGLTDDESMVLVHRLHPFDENGPEAEQVRELATAVDNHAMALSALARSATARRGLTTLTEHVGRVLDGTSDTMTKVAEIFVDRLDELDDEYQRATLRVLAACGPAAMPARQLRNLLSSLGMDQNRVLESVESLQTMLLVRQVGAAWQTHGLIRQAVRSHLDARTIDWIASTYAKHLVAVLRPGRAGHGEQDWNLLVRHARFLVEQPIVETITVNALLPLIARELRVDGRLGSAARYLDRLVAAGPGDPQIVLEAAADHYDVGEYEEVVTMTSRAFLSSSGRERVLLSCVHASTLDALGRFADAEPHWRAATDAATLNSLTEAERVKVRLRWIRGQRLRGVLKASAAALEELLTTPELRSSEDLRLLALIELAHIQLLTGAQNAARSNARQVLDHFAAKKQQHHAAAAEAEYVLATAQLQLQFTELKARPDRWVEAEARFLRLADELEEQYGARNAKVLACRVNADWALISHGQPKKALDSTAVLLPVVRERLGEHHPLVLREHYVRGLAHSQLGEIVEGADELGTAHRGQLTTLGIVHPETLRTQFELAIALKLRDHDGDNRRANVLLDEVWKHANHVTGWLDDLPWQAFFGATLVRWTPVRALRGIHRANHKHKW
ncbi:hypothetical protein BBK82_38285 [Lentzea guizhouensis]|uniref:TIR domain-containing protein n=2 Tax=Lentzea guizhouensis TaxID=1586287 RepID=A0A1B2HTE5_9PSEU|nr:hypothetical protein BBK82_38285 [Lentzea guizhouensis]